MSKSKIVTITEAATDDFGMIADIYAFHVQNGYASFEEEPPTRDILVERFLSFQKYNLPYLVAKDNDGQITGYGYCSPFRPRTAYRFTVEDSVYVHPDFMGQGFGGLILDRLILNCEHLNMRQMIAVIGDWNTSGSIALHRSRGFSHAGILQSAGFKQDEWRDIIIMQKSLGAGDRTSPL